MAASDIKAKLRAQLRRQRDARYTEHTLVHLLNLPEFSKAQVIASYYSYGSEPNTYELNQSIIESGRTLLLPRIIGESLEWVKWDGDAAHLAERGKFHEPIGEPLTNLSSIDLVLVPALAIDPDGYRLGQGGGYYDRALPELRAWKHGVVYPFERMEHDLPREAWDIAVDSW
jgi:5-formyltetrahydrofolate cyclo-ligase